jgi:hypothetical protein
MKNDPVVATALYILSDEAAAPSGQDRFLHPKFVKAP